MVLIEDILRLIKSLIDIHPELNTSSMKLSELGLDSLDIIKLLVMIQEEYSTDLLISEHYISAEITLEELLNDINSSR